MDVLKMEISVWNLSLFVQQEVGRLKVLNGTKPFTSLIIVCPPDKLRIPTLC